MMDLDGSLLTYRFLASNFGHFLVCIVTVPLFSKSVLNEES